jgi:hypothetical protein
MESQHRVLAVSALVIAAFTVASASANAGTTMRVHSQGSPNVYAVRVSFLNSNGLYMASKTVIPGGTQDWFLPNDEYVIVVFNQDTREVIATKRFKVTDDNPATTAARVWRDMNNDLQLYWGYSGTQTYEEAYPGGTEQKAAK